MRASVACITSRHETCRVWIAPERACAGRSVMSMLSPGAGQDARGCRLVHDRLERSFAQVVQLAMRQPVMGSDLGTEVEGRGGVACPFATVHIDMELRASGLRGRSGS